MKTYGNYDKYFYFRTVTDEDNDDDFDASLIIPVGNITGLEPYSGISNIRLWFEGGQGRANAFDFYPYDRAANLNSYVDLAVTRGKIKEVMEELVSAMNAGPHHDGVIVVRDEVTTDYDGSVRSAVTLSNDITAVSNIVNN